MNLSPSRKRLLPIALVVSAPLTYALGGYLLRAFDPNARINFGVDRETAIARAAQYASSLGVDVSEWQAGCRAKINNDLFFYYRLHSAAPFVGDARRLSPESGVEVQFNAPDGQERINITLEADGRPAGYVYQPGTKEGIADQGEGAARTLADETFQKIAAQYPNLSAAGPAVFKEERKFSGVIRRYTYHNRLPQLPELDVRAEISVWGGKVVGQSVTASVDEEYAKQNLLSRQTSLKLLTALYWLMLFVINLYGIYRYLQRTRQKEVPHVRSALLSLVAAVIFIFFALQTDFHVFDMKADGAPPGVFWVAIVFTSLVFIAMGVLFGVAYGSGEGDVREAYPGKLTSLDVLLTGRLFSRNVARAFCLGCGIGGLALLTRVLLWLPWATRPDGAGLAERTYSIYFGSLTTLTPFLTSSFHGLTISVFGLLLPLSLLHRHLRSRRLFFAALIIISLSVNFDSVQDRPVPLLAALLQAVVATAALLIPFFLFDLLTAIFAVSLPALVVFSVNLISQPIASIRYAGLANIAGAGLLLAAAFYLSNRSREYSEDEVRPLYARLLAQRLGMQAEVSAAREAQVRLMPQQLPQIADVKVAAACRPARVVGGDFYDVFPIDAERIGVFLAEGGGRGLEAAMTIAFAKGFLMPRVRSVHSPSEIIVNLQNQLLPMLGQEQELMAAYAVINTTDQTINYARIGDYPKAVHLKHRAALKSGSAATPAEREVDCPWGVGTNCVIREASITLQPGDAFMLLADTIYGEFEREGKSAASQFVNKIRNGHGAKINGGEPTAPAEASAKLQTEMLKNLEAVAKKVKRHGAEDDLTAVIVYLQTKTVGER